MYDMEVIGYLMVARWVCECKENQAMLYASGSLWGARAVVGCIC